MESNTQNFLFGIATNLASDLINAGFKHLSHLTLGNEETRALQNLWESVFDNFAEELFISSEKDLALEVANVFKYFIYEPNVAETLIDWTLTNKEPDLNLLQGAFQQAGFDTIDLPLDFGNLITTIKKHLYNQLSEEASRFGSPLSNRVNTARIADIQGKVELALTFIHQKPVSFVETSVFHAEYLQLSHFFGRREEIEKLTIHLLSETPRVIAITALQGMGGVGKTALAKKIAHDLASRFPGGVLWADFPSNEGNPQTILASWAQLCNRPDLIEIPSEDIRAQAVQRAIAAHIQKNGNVLVIFDDVRETEIDPWLHCAHLLKKALPQDTPIIITTRQTEVAISLRAETMPLDVMEIDDALDFVLFSLPYISRDMALHLVKLVGNLPLAIEIAIALSKIDGIDWVINSLEDPISRLGMFEFQDKLKDDNIWTSFSISYDSLDIETASLFRLLGAFAQGKIKKEWIVGVVIKTLGNLPISPTNERLLNRALRNLRYRSLINWFSNDSESYQLHPLLRDYSKMLLSENSELDKASIAHRKYFLEFIESKQDDFVSMENAIENIMQAARYSFQEEAWEDVCVFTERSATFGKYLYKRGLRKYALELLNYGVESASNIHNLGIKAQFLCDTGIFHRESGNYEDAEKYFLYGIEICKDTNNSFVLSTALSNLGLLMVYQRRSKEAKRHFEDAINITRKVKNKIALGQSILGISRMLIASGDIKEARVNLRKCLRVLSDSSAQQLYVFSLRAYAETFAIEGKHQKASEYYYRALDNATKINDLQAQAYTLRGLGDMYKSIGDIESAIKAYTKSENLYRDVADKAALAGTLCSLGDVYLSENDFGKARICFNESLALASEKRWRARSQFGIAQVEHVEGNPQIAKDLAVSAYNLLTEFGHRDAKIVKKWIESHE